MDDEEYERLQWADIDRKMDAHRKYEITLPGLLDRFLFDLRCNTYEFEQVMSALESALAKRKIDIEKKWERESSSKKRQLLERAVENRLGNFESFDELWMTLGRPEPGIKTVWSEIYHEFSAFHHYFHQDHFSQYETEMSCLLRYGSMISAHAFLESQLESLYTLFCDYKKVAKLERYSKKNLNEKREYLEKAVGRRIPEMAWQNLDVFVQIRHCIAHESGRIDADIFRDKFAKHHQHFGAGKVANIENGRLILFEATGSVN